MKKFTYFLLFIIGFSLVSCEDVVDVDLDTAAPRLVIDASIQWPKGSAGNEQQIKLSTTTGFYDTNIPTVSGAIITVTNSVGQVFNFAEEVPGSGIYLCHDFVPQLNETYVMAVLLGGDLYTATEILKPVAEITTIEQNNEGGFTGEDIEIKTYFNDPGATQDYYLFRYKPSINAVPSYDVSDDEFYNGNEFFGYYSNEDIQSGDTIDITLYGVSKRYFEYMAKLILIAQGSDGPFGTPPATVRGNIVNQTDAANFALGYFNLSETDQQTYVLE